MLPNVRFSPLLAAAILALCGLPLPWSALTPLPLAWLFASVLRPGRIGLRLWAAMTVYFSIQLWWLVAFMHDRLVGSAPAPLLWPLAALLLFPLMLLEGGFFGLLGYAVSKLPQRRQPWALACGWVALDYLRGLGPLAFPWAEVGYTLLPTPLAQVADLGGVPLLELLVVGLAAALANVALRRDAKALQFTLLAWLLALSYGLSCPPAAAPDHTALLLRTDYDSFSKAAGDVGALWAAQQRLSAQRLPGELVIWSETSLFYPQFLPTLPDGIYGLGQGGQNTAVGVQGGQITGRYVKAHPVPFGEYFPLADGPLRGLYEAIFQALGLSFEQEYPATQLDVLPLRGALYGVYICYDSIFPGVARQLALEGAQVLVNVSNDGWYAGWGGAQHFAMGRLRAIETRRWVLRSVNKGVAGAVNERGEVLSALGQGEGALHVSYAALSGQTLYTRYGDWAGVLALLSLLWLWRPAAKRPAR